MNFNEHSNLKGTHAFLSASQYHWLNYDRDKLITVYRNMQNKARGIELHDFAARAIELGIKLQKSKKTLNQYVNDAIGFRMTPEQVLYYSDNCYGTADAISFRANELRIHDLKTGESATSFCQLEIYAALFCLEYSVKPETLNDIILRIYQSSDIREEHPDPQVIRGVMNKIIECDEIIEAIKAEV